MPRRRLAVGEKEPFFVRFSKHVVNTVAFLCTEETNADGSKEPVPRASAFFVAVPGGTTGRASVMYVVTARHCIEATKNEDFWIRSTTADGEIYDWPTHREHWFDHDTADVSVAVFHPPQDQVIRLNWFRMEHFISAEHTVPMGESQLFEVGIATGASRPDARLEVEIGDAVIFLGLFVQEPGRKRNLPIARFGRVSRMPEEAVGFEWPDGSIGQLVGYLAECHSWGGHSGGPVLWEREALHFSELTVPEGMPGPKGTVWVQTPGIKQAALLGLVSGHFGISQTAKVKGDDAVSVTQKINAGMAVVTPAEAIRELLMREDVVSEREERFKRTEEERERSNAATFDIAPAAEDGDEFDRFEDLTRKLVNTPKPKPDEEGS